MGMNTKEEYEKFENEKNSKETLKANFTVKTAEKAMSEIIIYGTDEKTDNQNLVKSLESQNEANTDAKIKVKFRMKTQWGEKTIRSFEPGLFPLRIHSQKRIH